MSRREFFYAAPAQITDDSAVLLGEEHDHCTRVLRNVSGDRITIVDGDGHAFDGLIDTVERSRTTVRLLARHEHLGEPKVHLTLAQAVPKGQRFDWLVEKGTEIGISAFLPLRCERSEAITAEARLERWQRLALAAMKQSCRSVCPKIGAERSFTEVCDSVASYAFVLMAHEGAGVLGEKLSSFRGLSVRGLIMIGPEGGFTEAELERARNSPVRLFSLGPRRLRAETAGLVAATAVLAALGEL